MPTPGNSASSIVGGSSAAISFSHTLSAASGNRRKLVVVISARGSSTAAAATGFQVGGVGPTGTATTISAAEFGNTVTVQRLYWDDAALPAGAGSTTITGTTGSAAFGTDVDSFDLTNGAQGAPQAGNNVDLGTPTTSTVSVTTTAASAMIVDAVAVWHFSIAGVTPTAGQTEILDTGSSGSDRLGLGYEVVGAAGAYAQTWSWTGGAAAYYVAVAWAINHDAGGGAPSPGIVLANLAGGVAGTPFNHTLSSATNRGVVLLLDDESTNFASSVTYNGAAASIVRQEQSTIGAGNSSEQWVYFPPDGLAAGTYSVSVTHPSGGAAGVEAIEINNVTQAVPSAAQIGGNNIGPASTLTATATAPAAAHIAIAGAGHGNDPNAFNGVPTGTGTWLRMFANINPPTSAHFAGAHQLFSGGEGTISYTEGSAAAWNRESMNVALYVAAAADAAQNSFFGVTP